METTIVLFLPRKWSATKTVSYDQWHESQWQQDRRHTDLKGTNVVKKWSQQLTIKVESSFEHKSHYHQTRAPTFPDSDIDCGQPRRQCAGAPSQRYQATGNNYVKPFQLSISLYTSRDIFVSGNSWDSFGITCKKTKV